MPTLNSHKSRNVQRIMIVGDPGSAKTTAVGHLLEHGQKLFIADFDDNLDPIRKLVPAKFHENLVYETLVDKVRPSKTTGYPQTVGKPTAFRRFVNLLDRWVDSDGTDYGKPEEWDENTWLVIDTMTTMGDAIVRYAQDERGKQGEKVSLPTLGAAINRVEGIASTLMSYPINTIMLAHLTTLTSVEDMDVFDSQSEDKEAFLARKEAKMANPNSYKRYPYTLGKKLPRRIGAYFNVVLQTKVVGSGERATRVIRTVPDDDVDVKVPMAPKGLKAEVPINQLYSIIQHLREVAPA